MASNQDKAVIKIALEYYNDGASLKKSVKQAQTDVAKLSGNDSMSLTTKNKKQFEKEVKSAAMTVKKANLEMGNSFQRFGAQFVNFTKKLGQIASYGAAYKAVQLLTQGIQFAITKTIEFNKELIQLQVTSQFSVKELRELSVTIKEVAVNTEFSLSTIIQASTALAKLGFSAEETAELLPAVAGAASATGEAVEKMAMVVGKTMRAFGMDAENALNVTDRMIKAFNNSALDLQSYSTQLGYVGAAAKATGTSFNQVVSAMEILANAGVPASRAGTGLRNIFLKLADAGMDLNDVLEQVSEGYLEFSDIAAMVGTRGATQLFTLADAYEDFSDRVADSMENYGETLRQSAIKQMTWAAQIEAVKNRITSVLAGDSFIDENYKNNQNDKIGLLVGSAGSEKAARDYLNAYPQLLKDYWDEIERLNKDGVEEAKQHKQALEILGFTGDSLTYGLLLENQGQELFTKARATQLAQKAAFEAEDFQVQVRKEYKKIVDAQGFNAGQDYINMLLGVYSGTGETGKIDFLKTDSTFKDVPSAQLEQILSKKLALDLERIKNLDIDPTKFLKSVNAGDQKALDGVNLTGVDLTNAQEIFDEFAKTGKELCGVNPKLAAQAGWICKETGSKTRQKAFKFDGIERAGFENRLLGEDDPAERIKILEEYSNAYAKAAREYIKVSTDIERSKGAEDSSAMFGVGINKRIVREQEILLKESTVNLKDYYKKDVVAYAEFTRDLKKLAAEEDLAIGTKNKAAKRAEMIALNQQFFATQKANLSVAIMDLEEMVVSMESKLRFEDAEKLQAYIDKLRAEIIKLEGQLGLTVSDGKKDDPNKPPTRDQIISEALNTASTLASIQEQINEEKLRVLEEQADAELKIIEDRYDNEQTFTDAALKAGIVSQEQAQRAEEAANKRRIDAQNKVNKKLFEERKKAEEESILIQGIIQAAQVIASSIAQYGPIYGAVIGGVGAALIGIQTSMALSAKSKEKYTPIAYAEGGMVEGRSHAEGGVPFSVKGQGGYEMEGGEYIVNKKAVSDNFALLEAINGKTQGTQKVFAAGGIVEEVSNTPEQDIMFALLNALDRPVRAYVTDQDLARSESERRALEVKTNY